MAAAESFSVLRLSDASGKDFLRGLLLTGQCIPFIGAGFTAGERSFQGTVPGGLDFMSIMREAIVASPTMDKPDSDALKRYGFQQLADEYFREPIVDLELIKQTLRERFTGVTLSSEAKRSFLRWDWDYFYTLNIDDGIEREIGAIKVLPFTDFSQHKAMQFVYKLHGDALDAITAASREAFRLVFGNADYIQSLVTNRALLSTLSNDLAERHLLFVGCSLTDEIDILFSLADLKATGITAPATSRVYVTSVEPTDYESKKKIRRYGITHVLIVDYPEFYAFVGGASSPASATKSPLEPYSYTGSSGGRRNSTAILQYLLQIGWKVHEDPGGFAIPREVLATIDSLLQEPIVVLWGRRFSGRTSVLFSILGRHKNRPRFFIPSSASASDKVLNDILRTKDALIAVDAGAISYQQVQLLARKLDQVRANNTTIILATNRASLTALGQLVEQLAVEVRDKMSLGEAEKINMGLQPLGLSRNWQSSDRNLDNIFALSESPVVTRLLLRQRSRLHQNIERLHQQWTTSAVGRLEFSTLFYLGTRQRIYSRYFRELAKDAGLEHMSNTHFHDFSRQWEPFVELEQSEPSSMRSERSMEVIVSNAGAWIHYTIRQLSLKLGAVESAAQIVRTFSAMNKVEDKAFELLLFDNLNAIYSDELSDLRSKIIREVYERLAALLSGDPDYWLQRAKSLYYLSNDAADLLVGVEFCEKSIVQRAARTKTHAKLTKANLLGKICKAKSNVDDADLVRAIDAYVEAIESRSDNPLYIDELLRRSKSGKGYMSLVCNLASRRAALLPKKHDIQFITDYVRQRR